MGQAPQEAFSEEGTFELRFRMKVERMGPGEGRGGRCPGPGGPRALCHGGGRCGWSAVCTQVFPVVSSVTCWQGQRGGPALPGQRGEAGWGL